ncbi:hypothetical protein MON38_16100 [Hymenobacter sp. DH14]|uniref:Uncharacterized protein n=1 Tax=Hymenobacter cyanobacteriorum TaxID=2926463 RepID=A0A9X2AG74_9BACT|nr:hypothetical protein [Hymenobacter cyanobacteriorum]MCI1188946.1 hypothetical protein [Hymenobacter cyanobacteriorum]
MKVLAKILLAIFALFLLSGIGGYFYFRKKFQAPANQLVVSRLPAATSFAWEATKDLPHAALLVPISVPGCPRTCYLQFDTGAPYTLLKSNALAVLRAEYPATRATLSAQGDSVRNFQFGIGQGQVRARNIWVRPYASTAQLPANPNEPFVIGTLGTDVLDGRALIIDYARQRFVLASTAPDSLLRRATFVPMSFKERRVLLKVGLQGETKELMFDSGSSAFALLTSQDNWQQMAQPAATAQEVPVNSWGKTLTAHTVATAAAMQFGANTVPLGTVTYMDGTTFMQRTLTRFSGMGGMLGNAPFSQQTIILDAKNGRFGVVQPTK